MKEKEKKNKNKNKQFMTFIVACTANDKIVRRIHAWTRRSGTVMFSHARGPSEIMQNRAVPEMEYVCILGHHSIKWIAKFNDVQCVSNVERHSATERGGARVGSKWKQEINNDREIYRNRGERES